MGGFRPADPAAALIGGGFLLAIDTLARTMAPIEIPLGILTAFVGTPFFIWLLASVSRMVRAMMLEAAASPSTIATAWSAQPRRRLAHRRCWHCNPPMAAAGYAPENPARPACAEAGEVRLGDRSLAGYSSPACRLIAYVPQSHAATFAFTVETVVLMGRTAHGNLFSRPTAADRAVVARMLERFGIAHLADRPYTMISGGERQLALLARALAQEPQFVVLDEPTASLDFGNQGRVMREIRALGASGHGVLFTTHDPNHAMRAPTAPACCRAP